MAELTTLHSPASYHPQPLKLDARTAQVSTLNGEVLGADSSVGIWLLLNQLYFGVPGTYVFWHAQPHQADLDWLPLKTERLVFYGAQGDGQLINCINGQTTASLAFTQQLLKQLHQESTLSFKPTSIEGIQNRVHQILDQIAYGLPEIVHLSSGRMRGPDGHQTQNLYFASTLAHRLVRIPWSQLPVERDPQDGLSHWLETTQLDFENDPRPF